MQGLSSVVFRAFLCAVAALVGWVVTEPFMPTAINDPGWPAAELRMTFAVTAAIGIAGGVAQGWQRGGKRNILLGAAFGFLFGAIGGMLGNWIGGALVSGLFETNPFVEPGTNPVKIMARVIAFTPHGLLLGAAVGAVQFNKRTLLSGALGGLFAGAIAGLIFDFVSFSMMGLVSAIRSGDEIGMSGRAVLWLALGLFIGGFTALFDQISRRAWVRLILGKNEGKEWPVDAQETFVGRDERAHVPLFGDPQVAAMQAVIQKQGHHYWLADAAGNGLTRLNGQPVPQAELKPGDKIGVGRFELEFQVRSGEAQKMTEGRPQGQPVGGGPSAPQINQAAYSQPQAQPQHPQAPIQPGPAGNMAQPQTQTAMPGAAPSALTLVVIDGPMTGQRFPVQGPLELGREAAGVQLGYDKMASRRHAKVEPGGNELFVSDLGSTNGTFLNDKPVQQGSARPGDVLRVGSTSFRVEE
jgi:pSer/pThr/pTyr-binding forkhead associated (FHA) protein